MFSHTKSLRANVESQNDLPEITEIAFKALNTRKVRRDDRPLLLLEPMVFVRNL